MKTDQPKTDLHAKNTIKNYKVAYNQFISQSGLTEKQIKTMSPVDISKAIDKAFSDYIGAKTTILTKISSCRNYIENTFDISLPKSRDRKLLNKSKNKTTNKELLEKDEIEKIVSHFETIYKNANETKKLSSLRNLIIIKLLSGTGQRIGDILELTVSVAKRTHLFFKQEKTGAEVSIENPCLPEILFYVQAAGLHDQDFIFASGLTRKPLSYVYVNDMIIKGSLESIGKKITCHTFRAYVVSRLIELGYHANDIKSVTGHTDTRMVDYYNKKKGKITGLLNLLMSC